RLESDAPCPARQSCCRTIPYATRHVTFAPGTWQRRLTQSRGAAEKGTASGGARRGGAELGGGGDAVAAGGLGAVEGLVREPHHFGGGDGAVGAAGGADGDGYGE